MIVPVPLGPADAPALYALHAPLFDPPWSEQGLAHQLSQPGVAALGSWDQAGLCGFVLLQSVLDEAEILILAVAPEHRRHGIGRALLESATRLVTARGVGALWLEVAVDNAPALALYAAAGFEPAGLRPRYYQRRVGAAVDAQLLRRTFPTAPA